MSPPTPKSSKKAASKKGTESSSTPKISLNKSKNKVLQQQAASVVKSSEKAIKKAPSSSPSRKPKAKSHHQNKSTGIDPSLEVLLPTSLLSTNNNAAGDCTVLVQIDPDDATTLDFEGATGAIGRFQADDQGIVLDLKGSQYRGTIFPGPTALLASLHYNTAAQQQLRIEAMTDEFCPLVKTQDILAKFDAQIEGTMDDSYKLQEEDVNVLAREERQLEAKEKKAQTKAKQQNGGTHSSSNDKKAASSSTKKKRATSTGGNNTTKGGSSKKQKISLGKK